MAPHLETRSTGASLIQEHVDAFHRLIIDRA
jgi:hypothetical protein